MLLIKEKQLKILAIEIFIIKIKHISVNLKITGEVDIRHLLLFLYKIRGGKEMYIRSGTNPDELMEFISQMETKSTSIIKGANKLQVEIDFNDDVPKWKMYADKKSPSKIIKHGKTFNGFQEEISTLDKTIFIGEGKKFCYEEICYVICHVMTEEFKFHGKYISYWYKITPGTPFIIDKDLQPHFEIIQLKLDDWEFEQMMQVRIAFMYEGIIYPVTKNAVNVLGTLLDCNAAFKQLDEYQLGSAILLSEKLSYCKKLQLIYRDCSKQIRPLLSVAGRSYKKIDLNGLFHDFYSKISEQHIFDADYWEIKDTSVDLYLSLITDHNMGIAIHAGNLPGEAISVTAYVNVSGVRVPLRRNKLVHKGSLQENYMDSLYDGIEESIENIKLVMQTLQRNSCKYEPSILKELSTILGKKRMKSIDGLPNENEEVNGYELLNLIVQKTSFPLPEKQDNDRKNAYHHLLFEIERKCCS